MRHAEGVKVNSQGQARSASPLGFQIFMIPKPAKRTKDNDAQEDNET